MSEEGGDDASETTVNIIKSPVAPKGGVQPCEPPVIADLPSLGSQAPVSSYVCFKKQQQLRKEKDRNTEGMEAMSIWCCESEPGKVSQESEPCEDLSSELSL